MENHVQDALTIKQFAEQTGLTESYVRSLISRLGENGKPIIPTSCPVPGMQRPRVIDKALVAKWKRPSKTGRPRACCRV